MGGGAREGGGGEGGGVGGVSREGLGGGAGVRVRAGGAGGGVCPAGVRVVRELLAAGVRMPAVVDPVVLGLCISVVSFAWRAGVPGFIYASF